MKAPVNQPSLFDIWNTYRFLVSELVAAVPDGAVVFRMLGNQPVREEDAKHVLSALSQILGKDLTLEMVYVPIVASGEPLYEKTSEVTQQEVYERLSALNRATYRWCDTIEEKRARSLMIQNHLQWFAHYGLTVYQEGCHWLFP